MKDKRYNLSSFHSKLTTVFADLRELWNVLDSNNVLEKRWDADLEKACDLVHGVLKEVIDVEKTVGS